MDKHSTEEVYKVDIVPESCATPREDQHDYIADLLDRPRKQAKFTTVEDIQAFARKHGYNLPYDVAKEISIRIDIARSVEVFNEEQPALFAQKMKEEYGIDVTKKHLDPQLAFVLASVIFIVVACIIATLLGY